MEHARHVFRVLLVLLVGGAVVFLGRGFLVPKSYGMYGAYRFDNVAEQAQARPPLHGGRAACGECHDEKLAKITKGAHRPVSCEICHGPLGIHVRDGDVLGPMPVDRSFTLCARCHRKVEGRPAAFPQIAIEQHAGGEATSGKACLECHDPHSPKL